MLTKTKVCTKCNEKKLLSEFYKDSNQSTGLRPDCKKCKNKIIKEYVVKNRDLYLLRKRNHNKIYSITHKERKKQTDKIWLEKNREHRRSYQKEYYQTNKNKINKKQRNRRKTDIQFRLSNSLRSRLNLVLKRKDKALSTMFLLGCEVDYLMYHIQEKFTKGMTWDNYGLDGWHIDHIRPCASFDLTEPKQQKQCFHYTNLQPLWAIDNLKKGSK